jgi:hypothetical protein
MLCKPRVDYYVEFESAEAALKVWGIIDPREGEIHEGYFVGETEFRRITALSQAVLQQAENLAETAPTPEPYAGGRYVREEPPLSSNLPFTASTAATGNTSLFKPMGTTGQLLPQSSSPLFRPIKAPPPRSGFLA